jgi:hypothetical protein
VLAGRAVTLEPGSWPEMSKASASMAAMSSQIADHSANVLRAWYTRLETECEKALQSGTDGVLLVHDGCTMISQVSSHVPYGMIYEIGQFGRTVTVDVAATVYVDFPDAIPQIIEMLRKRNQ